MGERGVDARWLLVVWLVGCAGAPTPPPLDELTPSVEEVAPAEDPPPPPAVKTPEIPLELFHQLAKGEVMLGDFIDPGEGLLLTEANTGSPAGIDERSEPDGSIRLARRACGQVLYHQVERLSQELKADAERALDAMVCEGLVCRVPGQLEYDLDEIYTFRVREGGFVLESVQSVEAALVEPEVAEALSAWSADAATQRQGGRCDRHSPENNAWFYRVCHTAQDRSPGLPLRNGPSWDDDEHTTILPGRVMRDGLLVEDLGGRDDGWWRVRVLRTGDVGWVVSTNSDKRSPNNGKPVLCPVESGPP